METGDEIKLCSPSSQTYRMLDFVKKALHKTCLIYKNVQCFLNGPVHKFYGLKASQMSKVHASSHKYPHVEKVKNFREQNFKGTQ